MQTPTGRGPVAVLLDQAFQAWRQRQLFEAIRFTQAALRLEPTGADLARARLYEGSIYREIGDTHLALQNLLALLADPHPDPQQRPIYDAYAHYNLGLVHRQRLAYLGSAACYTKAAAGFRALNFFDDERAALQNLAWVLCLLGRSDEAVAALEQAAPLVSNADPEGHLQQRLGTLFAMLVDRAYDEVLERAPVLIHDAEGHPLVQTQAALLAGQAYLAMGDLDQTSIMAEAAHQWATEASDMRCVNDAIALKREIAARREKGA